MRDGTTVPELPDGESGSAQDGPARADGDVTGIPDGGTPMGGRGGGGMGGAMVSDEIRELLLDDADSYTWVAAAIGSQGAAGYQLATERVVMPVGGFNGTDPSPTLDEFKQYVSDGRIHYFISGSQGGGVIGSPGAKSDESIASWVEESFESVEVDGVTLYDLTKPKASE